MQKLTTTVAILAAAFVGCVGPVGDPLGQANLEDGEFALTNTTASNPNGLLRGQGLKVYTEIPSASLRADSVYDVLVTNDNSGSTLSAGQLRSTSLAEIRPYALLFDVGQYGLVEEGDNIRVEITDDLGTELTRIISLGAVFAPGWDVAETEPPEVFSCDSNGEAANAFAVGGIDPGEVGGEIHLCGQSFPTGYAGQTVDVYVVDAEDNWIGEVVPQAGQPGHVYGPVEILVGADGSLAPTGIGFIPGLEDVGIYDILVDLDGNGIIEESLSLKDSGDGLGEQVGFTVQYSQAWVRARGERHILVNMAYNSGSRSGGEWSNTFRAGSSVFTYLNPPVMHRYHFSVTKYIVAHQDFELFWNNRDRENNDGCIPFAEHVIDGLEVPTQRGCTNTGPVDGGAARFAEGPGGERIDAFDVVFDRNGDGCYMPGEDLLDVVGGAYAGGDLVPFDEFNRLPPEERCGFRVE